MNKILRTIYSIPLDYFLVLSLHIKSLIYKSPPVAWKKGKKGDVVLLQGFGETRLFLKTADELNRTGYRIHVINELNYNHLPIKKCSEIVEKYIEDNKLKDVILLSHSKGGIMGKYFLDNSKLSSNVKCLISIATPYKGSFLSCLRILYLNEFSPKSEIINSLKKPINGNKILNLYPIIDTLIIPNKANICYGAKNICINTIGHARVLESKQTQEEIIKFLL